MVDYMHGTLLGIAKKLLELWFDPKHKETEHYIGSKRNAIDDILKNIYPPYIVYRLPWVLLDTYSHWKASELCNWLLFCAVPCLQNILLSVYLKHLCCLIESTLFCCLKEFRQQTYNRLKRCYIFLNKILQNYMRRTLYVWMCTISNTK